MDRGDNLVQINKDLGGSAGSSGGEQKKSRKASREGEESRGDREFGLLRAGCGLF